MKFIRKNLLAISIILCILFSLSACNNTADNLNSNNTDNSVETSNVSNSSDNENMSSIVAVINGKSITRADVGDSLISAEQDAISSYIYSQLLNEFFSGVEVTDTELEVQLEMIKSQVGEDSWPIYLSYYGGGDEDTFREMLRSSLRREKYITERGDSITVTNEDIKNTYDIDPDSYNIAVLNVVFLADEDELNKAIEMKASGNTIDEIAENLETEVSEGEHTYFKSDSLNWSTPLSESKVGDIIYTDATSGSIVIGEIAELHIGVEDSVVVNDMMEELKYSAAYDVVQEEYYEFLKNQKAQIFGEDYELYTEEENLDG